MVVSTILFVLPFLWVPGSRPLARIAVGLAVVAAYQTLFVAMQGATPGKLIVGTRVVPVGAATVDVVAAAKRGTLVALGSLAVIATGWSVLYIAADATAQDGDAEELLVVAAALFAVGIGVATSVLGSPLRRGFDDRVAGTVVVDRTVTRSFSAHELAALASLEHPPTVTPFGPAASFDQRRRARSFRLDGSPLLVLLLVGVAFVGTVSASSGWLVALVGIAWIVGFVADETWRVSRFGATSGHRRLGLAVVDAQTGEAPTPLQASSRAIVLAVTLYVLPGLVLLGLAVGHEHEWVLSVSGCAAAMLLCTVAWPRFRPGRSLHDLAAHTMVVAPPSLAPAHRPD